MRRCGVSSLWGGGSSYRRSENEDNETSWKRGRPRKPGRAAGRFGRAGRPCKTGVKIILTFPLISKERAVATRLE